MNNLIIPSKFPKLIHKFHERNAEERLDLNKRLNLEYIEFEFLTNYIRITVGNNLKKQKERENVKPIIL